MDTLSQLTELEAKLNDFSAPVRAQALAELVILARQGDVSVVSETELINLHCHTFYSYNAYGFSPTYIAWLAKKNGYRFMGIVDFDVLDGVDEFLHACEILGIRGSAGMETRVYIPEFGDTEINSPGEPGIAYHMGIGFTSSTTPADAAQALKQIRQCTTLRNLEIIRRLNDYLAPLSIDYQKNVLPLTPNGNATERHMVFTLIQKARQTIPQLVAFWAEKLNQPKEKIAQTIRDESGFQNLVRSKLMKRGGVGYIQPTMDTFPAIEEFNRIVEECQALPCAAWLDGTSAGEQRIEELLGLLVEKGVVALNIIPDRNWNINDPQIKKVKVNNLFQVVELANRMDLSINVGTEMNSPGQKLIDDFTTAELAPLHDTFMRSAYFIYGHTRMQSVLGKGYQSQWAKKYLPSRHERNEFFSQIGKLIAPDAQSKALLAQLDTSAAPNVIIEQYKKIIESKVATNDLQI